MIELRIQRGYVTASVAATVMGVSRQRVHQLLTAGRIPGAFLMDCGDGREMWVVPRKELKQKRKEQSNVDRERSREIPATV